MNFHEFDHISTEFSSPKRNILHRAQRSTRRGEVRRGGAQLPSTAPGMIVTEVPITYP